MSSSQRTNRKFGSGQEIWQAAQWATQSSRYKLSRSRQTTETCSVITIHKRYVGRNLRIILLPQKHLQDPACWTCWITHLRYLVSNSIAEPCLNYFADRYVASSCCEPLPPGPQRWMEESFSVVTQLERNCWGHQVKNRELEMTAPSSLQDVALGPIAGDGWRGRRLPASLKEQLLKKT